MSELEIFFEIAGLVVLVITTIIIYWYTRETVGLRRAAQEQNSLIAEQIRIAQRAYNLAIEKESRGEEKDRSLLDPILVCRGGNSGGATSKMSYANNGGAIKNISLEPQGDFRVLISPPDSISTGGSGHITASELKSPEKHFFKLRYENAVGEKRVKTFSFSHGRFDEVKSWE